VRLFWLPGGAGGLGMTPGRGWAAVTGRGWALETGGGRLIGVGWFQDSTPWNRQAGHNLMVWPTRREARAALRDRLIPRARVVPVSVTVAPRRVG
jgi:hypothetical protein